MAETPIIFDTSDGQQLRINMISPWLKNHYEELGLSAPAKIVKLSLDGGFTCPNRDGSKGTGGCLFCSESGSGDMASSLAGTDGASSISNCSSAPGGTPVSNGSSSNGSSAPGGTPDSNGSSSNGSGIADGISGSGITDGISGSGITAALNRQIELLSDKWPADKYNLKYIAYFQSHTNTYAPAEELRAKFEAALETPGVVGLAIATRPDCLPDDVLDLLSELNEKTFMWVELGLQTIHDETARAMNLYHALADYDDAVRKLTARGIRIVTHLILGLPGETREMMLDSVRYVCRPVHSNQDHSAADQNYSRPGKREYAVSHDTYDAAFPHACKRIFGLKLHMLNVVRGSGMASVMPDYVPFGSMEEYIDLLISALELVPPEVTLHRISGDAPRSTLIAPEWSYKKRTILNNIHREMRIRNTWQGRRV